MKTIYAKLLLVVALGFGFIGTAAAQTPYVEVRGNASTTVAPNKIEVVVKLNEEQSKGRVKLATLERQFATALRACGISAKDDVSVISQSSVGNKAKSSYLFKNYLVTLATAEELATFFDELKKNEINSAFVQRVVNTEVDEIRSELRIEAMKNARAKAEELSAALGQGIGVAIQITDYSSGGDAVAYTGGGIMMRSNAYMDSAESAELSSEVDFKPIEVEQSVSVRFELLGK